MEEITIPRLPERADNLVYIPKVQKYRVSKTIKTIKDEPVLLPKYITNTKPAIIARARQLQRNEQINIEPDTYVYTVPLLLHKFNRYGDDQPQVLVSQKFTLKKKNGQPITREEVVKFMRNIEALNEKELGGGYIVRFLGELPQIIQQQKIPVVAKPYRAITTKNYKDKYYYLGDHSVWDTENNQCAVDYFYYKYANIKKIYKKDLHFENVGDVIDKCKELDISCYLINPSLNLFEKHQSTNNNYPPLYLLTNNTHIYPIEDKHMQRQISNKGKLIEFGNLRIDWKNAKIQHIEELGDVKSFVDDLEKSKSNVFIIESFMDKHEISDLISMIHKLTRYIPEYIQCNNRGASVTGFNYKDKSIIIDTHYSKTVNILRAIKQSEKVSPLIKTECFYQQQSPQALIKMLIEIPDLCTYNKRAEDFIYTNEPRPYVDYQVNKYPKGTKSIDIKRCHTHAVYSRTEDYGLYDISCDVQEYKGESTVSSTDLFDNPLSKAPLPIGEYMINKPDLTLGNKYYKIKLGNIRLDQYWTRKLLDGKFIEPKHITHYMKASSYIESNHFKNAIDFIYSLEIDDQFKKDSVNHLIGSFARKTKYESSVTITTDKDMCDAICVREGFKSLEKQEELYIIYKTEEKLVSGNHRTIYNSVVMHSIWCLHKLVNDFVGPNTKVCAVQTDSIKGINLLEVELKEKPDIGDYRSENNFSERTTEEHAEYNTYEYEPCTLDNLEGALWLGPAGTGKSYNLMRNLPSKLNYLVTGYSYKVLDSLRNKGIKGEKLIVLAKLLMKPKNKTEDQYLKELAGKIHCLFVDEFTCVTWYNMKKLYKLFKLGVEMFFFGDPNQLAPIGKFPKNYIEYDFFKEMTGNNWNYLRFTDKSRYDKALFDTSMKFLETSLVPDLPKENSNYNLNTTYLCYTRAQVKKINESLMQNFTKDPRALHSSTWHLPIGSSVICDTNNLISKDLFNNRIMKLKWIQTNKIGLEDNFGKVEINKSDFIKYFQPAFAMTVHKSQGSTLEGKVCIVVDSHIFSKNCFYTAMTRATSLNNLSIKNLINRTQFKEQTTYNFNKNNWSIEPYNRQTKQYVGYIYGLFKTERLASSNTKRLASSNTELKDTIFYIGQTTDRKERLAEHQKNYGEDIKMKTLEIVPFDDKEELLEMETAYIEKFTMMGFELKNVQKVPDEELEFDLKPFVFEPMINKNEKLVGSFSIKADKVVLKYKQDGCMKTKVARFGKKRTEEQAIEEIKAFQLSLSS